MSIRIVVTGATGRLGGALVERIGRTADVAVPWTRAEFDLDRPEGVDRALGAAAPALVIHAAAWTDVDGCARDPERAEARNGTATGALARACARAGIDLLIVSTNEVFDGRRVDGRAYRVTDPIAPLNPYGRSKATGETLARQAFEGAAARLWVVRTAWLFGPPGADFPAKILAAARLAVAEGRGLKLVADEVGSPSFAPDVAAGILDLVGAPASAGVHHVVNTGHASRAEWARLVLDRAGVAVPTEDVPMATWSRASTPPAWAPLEATDLPTLGRLRPWHDAVAADVADRFSAAAA